MKLCRDCKHMRCGLWLMFIGSIGGKPFEFAQCYAPQNNTDPEPIAGGVSRRYDYCGSHRMGQGSETTCGLDGVWFESRK
jgi:hypothetical protein